MLTCVYGSSEYTQAFSRTGSIFGNVYVVNSELKIGDCVFTQDEAEEAKLRFESIKFNYNDEPLKPKKGILVGSDYQTWFLKQANRALDESQIKKVSCARVTVISYKPLSEDLTDGIATFVYPPGTYSENEYANRHPIRVF